MSSVLTKISACVLGLTSAVYGHSWLACTDYDDTVDGYDNWNEGSCNGYTRSWADWGSSGFGDDKGINYFGSDSAWCQKAYSSDIDSMYSSTYPVATYNMGDTITLVWPAKNHANYGCFSNIPDTTMKIFYNPTPDQSADLSSIGDWDTWVDFQDGCEGGTDGCGFQNCVNFCDNTDRATCYGEVEVTSDKFSSSGYYTFMWYWEFNQGSGVYTTCFEAYVDTSGSSGGSGGTDDDSSSSSSSSSGNDQDTVDSATDYIVQVPLCYAGGSFVEETVLTGANDAHDSWDADWSIVGSVSESGNVWNATIQTLTNDPGTVTSSSYDWPTDTSDVCDSIETALGDGGNCKVCDPGAMQTYKLTDAGAFYSVRFVQCVVVIAALAMLFN